MAGGPRPKDSGQGKAAAVGSKDEEASLQEADSQSVDTETDEEDDDQGCRPDTVERRCTDLGWFFPFILGLTALSMVTQYALQHGNLKNFRAFMDFDGGHCYSHSGERYLYFCQNHPGELNISTPICVKDCPNETKRNHSFACEAYGIYKNTSDYSTEPYFGMLCVPMMHTLRNQVEEYIIQTRHLTVKRLILRNPETIVGTVILAVCTSYIYLAFVGRCAHVVVWTGLIIAMLVPVCIGLYFLSWTTWIGLVPRPTPIMGNLDGNPVIGAVLLFIGVSFACCGMRMGDSVNKAMMCLEESIDCCMETPVLQWQPVFHLVWNLVGNFVPVVSIMFLLSCQNVGLAYQDSGPLVHLLLLTRQQCLYMVVLVFMFFWISNTNLMTSTFVITYVATLWCYYEGEDEGQVKHRAILQAYWAVYRYHFGTMLKGGLAVGFLTPVRFVMGMVVGFTEMKANAVGTLVSTACCFCIACYERWFEHVNRAAFIEVALNARPFCPAAKVHMRIVLDYEADTKRILHGASRVFQWAGLTMICFTCGVAMILVRTYEGDFETDSDRQLILTQTTFGMLGLLLSFIVASPFMMLFQTVADTILYIRLVEKLRSVKEQDWTWSPTVLQCVCCKRMRPDLPGLSYGDYEELEYDDRPSSPDKRGAKTPGRSQRSLR